MDLDVLIRKASDERVDIDFLRDGIAMLAQTLMEVDVTNRIGAALGEHNHDGRTTHRKGYRSRTPRSVEGARGGRDERLGVAVVSARADSAAPEAIRPMFSMPTAPRRTPRAPACVRLS